jgi:DNA-binding NtrC family response regulator
MSPYKKILVIADDKKPFREIEDIFAPLGYTVEAQTRIKTGIKSRIKSIDRFKLILLVVADAWRDFLREIKTAAPDSLVIMVLPRRSSINTVIETIKAGAYYCLRSPLNIEELKIAVERASDKISIIEDLQRLREMSVREFLESRLNGFIGKMSNIENADLHKTVMSEVEKSLLSIALKESNGNCLRAAKLLGINRNTLNKKIKEYKLIN